MGTQAVRRWGVVARQAATDLWANNAMEWAAALAFYALLSLFPLALAAAAAASYLVEPGWAAARLADLLAGFVPPEVVDADAVVAAAIAERGRVGLLAIVSWLVAGRRILGALVTVLNRVSDVDERRESLARRALVELGLLGGVGGLFALALSAAPLLDLLWAAGEAGSRQPVAWLGAGAVRLLLLVATFWALYAIVPHGERGRGATLLGALAAAALFLAARAVFLAALNPIPGKLQPRLRAAVDGGGAVALGMMGGAGPPLRRLDPLPRQGDDQRGTERGRGRAPTRPLRAARVAAGGHDAPPGEGVRGRAATEGDGKRGGGQHPRPSQ